MLQFLKEPNTGNYVQYFKVLLCVCVCNCSLVCVVWSNYEVVGIQPRSGNTTAWYSVAIFMCTFLPLLVFHRPLVLPWIQHHPPSWPRSAPYHPAPICRPLTTSALQGNLSTWTSPGSHYPAYLLSGSCLVYPMASPFSPTVVSLCLPHVAFLDPLARPGQLLLHVPLTYPLLLHSGVSCTNSARQWEHNIYGTI